MEGTPQNNALKLTKRRMARLSDASQPNAVLGRYRGSQQAGMDLVAAIKKRSFTKALQLVAGGADVNSAGPRGETPLLWAVIHGNEELVGALLAAGARPTPRTKGKRGPGNSAAGATPLHFATNPGPLAVLLALIRAGAEVEVEDAVGLTPLAAGPQWATSPLCVHFWLPARTRTTQASRSFSRREQAMSGPFGVCCRPGRSTRLTRLPCIHPSVSQSMEATRRSQTYCAQPGQACLGNERAAQRWVGPDEASAGDDASRVNPGVGRT